MESGTDTAVPRISEDITLTAYPLCGCASAVSYARLSSSVCKTVRKSGLNTNRRVRRVRRNECDLKKIHGRSSAHPDECYSLSFERATELRELCCRIITNHTLDD